MEASLARVGSGVHCASGAFSISRHNSLPAIFSGEKAILSSPTRMSLRVSSGCGKDGIRRVSSESEFLCAENEVSGRAAQLDAARSRSFPWKFAEGGSDADDSVSWRSRERSGSFNHPGGFQGSSNSAEGAAFSGDGVCSGRNSGGDGGHLVIGTVFGGNNDWNKIGDGYRKMLKSDPNNPLLLRNYGKFLHEVEKDSAGAAEYYGRAILASPGDGELLSLYGSLIWEIQRDEERAKSYLDQAVYASPNDSVVLGSYARFVWETDDLAVTSII